MGANDFVQVDPTAKPPRVRRLHAKVRTGCLTCKFIKKKCDETKPVCRRCQTTGRHCDGYAEVKRQAVGITKAETLKLNMEKLSRERVPETTMTIWSSPRSLPFASDEDLYCFDFFRVRTGREFSAYFDSSVWRHFIVRASLVNRTVLQAAAAVGAAHRRFELGISSEAFRFCGIAAKQYRKTIQCLEEDTRSNVASQPELLTLIALLLSMFHGFQCDYDQAIDQYRSGLSRLFRQDLTRIPVRTRYQTAIATRDNLLSFTQALERQVALLFGCAAASPIEDGNAMSVPEVFQTLDEARDTLLKEGQHVWRVWDGLELGILKGSKIQQNHVSRLLEWSKAYAEFSKTNPRDDRRLGDRARYLLKVYREALYLVILAQVVYSEAIDETMIPFCAVPAFCTVHPACKTISNRLNALNAHFARVTILAEAYSQGGPIFEFMGEWSMSIDSGIFPSLGLSGNQCKSAKVRYQATSLLTGELQQQTWNKLGVYSLAEELITVEEQALIAAVAESLPDMRDAKWLEVTYFLDDRKMMLMHCKEDDFGQLLWTQEWLHY
jgi:hypothetical protein